MGSYFLRIESFTNGMSTGKGVTIYDANGLIDAIGKASDMMRSNPQPCWENPTSAQEHRITVGAVLEVPISSAALQLVLKLTGWQYLTQWGGLGWRRIPSIESKEDGRIHWPADQGAVNELLQHGFIAPITSDSDVFELTAAGRSILTAR